MRVMDIGNSAVRVAEIMGLRPGAGPDDLDCVTLAESPTPIGKDVDGLLAALDTGDQALPAVVVSVVPHLDEGLRAARPDVVFIDHRTTFPFAVAMPDAAAVGADRYCNVAAAAGAGLRDALVVDVGTAVTFDRLSDGVFAGGLIAPGPALAARALGERGARLPANELRPAPLQLGRSTADALAVGSWQTAYHGIVGTIEALLDAEGDCPVILTGGLGGLIREEASAASSGSRWRYDPCWTVKGAALLAVSS